MTLQFPSACRVFSALKVCWSKNNAGPVRAGMQKILWLLDYFGVVALLLHISILYDVHCIFPLFQTLLALVKLPTYHNSAGVRVRSAFGRHKNLLNSPQFLPLHFTLSNLCNYYLCHFSGKHIVVENIILWLLASDLHLLHL